MHLSLHSTLIDIGGFTSNNDRTATYQGIGGMPGRQLHHEPADSSSSNDIEVFHEKDRNAGSDRTSLTKQDSIADKEDRRRDAEVHELARKFTEQSTQSNYGENPFAASEDSPLNPRSANFSPRAFAKSLLNLQSHDPEKWKQRTSGFAYKDLNVYGFGTTTDYQKSVGNVVFEAVGLVKKLAGLEKPQKIDILQNLDGLVHSGEMLVVLGPPGR